jgi:pheromone shutdown-related protein TraB
VDLPPRVSHVQVEDKDVYLVGTAHISQESVEDVRATIAQVRPASVCIELCKARHQAMTRADHWRGMDIYRIIREKKATFLLVQLIMSSFYRRLGERLGVQPGAEMLEAIHATEQAGAQLVLADRDIEITLKRVWGYLGFWSKLKLATQVIMGLLIPEPVDAEMIEQLKKQDQLESIMAEFAQRFPEIKRRLIDERDTFLAQKIRTAPGKTVVAVVGAGHVEGIQSQIQQEHSLDDLTALPPKSIWPAVFKWGVPLLIVALFAHGFTKGATHGIENIFIWVLVTGTLAAVGSALALAHPLTILAAFVAAPVATLHPLLAAGRVAGIVQAVIERARTSDLEDLPDAMATIKGFWTHPVIRILLIVVLANIGSTIGLYVAFAWIGARSV